MRETTGQADVTSPDDHDLAGGEAPAGQEPKASGGAGGAPPGAADHVYRAASRGVASNVVLALGSKGAALASQVLITYFLDPTQLGLASLAVSTTSLAALLGGGAVTTILIQKRAPDAETEGQGFWLALALSSASALLMLALAPLAVAGFDDARLLGLIAIIACAGVVQSLTIVQSARLYARLRFGTLASIYFGMSILQSGGALALAVAGFGPFAVVLPILLSSSFGAAALLVAGGPPPLVRPRVRDWVPLVRAAFWILLGSWASTLQRQGVGLVLGFTKGAHVVGLFFWAALLAAQAVGLLLDRLQAVLLSSLANIADAQGRSRTARRACRVLVSLTCLLCLVQTLAAGPLISLVFPEQWHAAVPVVRALTLGLLAQPLAVLTQAVLFSQGRYRSFASIAAFFAVSQTAVCLLTATLGDLGVIAAGYAATAVVSGVAQGWIGYRALELSPGDLLRDFLPPVAACAVCLVLAEVLLSGWEQGLGQVTVACGGAASAYLVVLRALSYEGLRELIMTGQGLLQSLRPDARGVE